MEAERPTVYQMIGGEQALERLVEKFYDIIETDADGAIVHALHLKGFGMSHVRLAQFEFLSGFFGGPQYYAQRMGHANLRAMHEHIQIGSAEVNAWLICMEKALDALELSADLKTKLMLHFTRSAESLKSSSS
jgi:hemoglobin